MGLEKDGESELDREKDQLGGSINDGGKETVDKKNY